MSDEEIRVKGLAELQKALDALPGKLQKNVMRGALRAGLKPMLWSARAHIRYISGKLAKGLKIGTRSKGSAIVAQLATKGEHGGAAHLVEFGTSAHVIGGTFGKAMRMPDGKLVSAVFHPGAQPKPFMRPALDSQAATAVVETGKYIQKRLTKEGLETSDVAVEISE